MRALEVWEFPDQRGRLKVGAEGGNLVWETPGRASGSWGCRVGLDNGRRRAAAGRYGDPQGRGAHWGGSGPEWGRSGLCVSGGSLVAIGIAGHLGGLGFYTWSGGPRGTA